MVQPAPVDKIPPTKKKCSKNKLKKQTSVNPQHSTSLFNEIESLCSANQTTSATNQTNPSHSTRANDSQTTASNNVIINNEDTGVARIIFTESNNAQTEQLTNEPVASTSASNNNSENAVQQHQNRTERSDSSGNSNPTRANRGEFAFNLPSSSTGRNVVISRSLTEEANNPANSRQQAADEDVTSDSELSEESSFSSDSDASDSSGEMRRYKQYLLNNSLSSQADTVTGQQKSTEALIQKLFICVSGEIQLLHYYFGVR